MRRLMYLTVMMGCAAPNVPDTRVADPAKDGFSARVLVQKGAEKSFTIRIVPQWNSAGFHTQAFDNSLIDHYEISLYAYGFGPFSQDGLGLGDSHSFSGVPAFDNMVAFIKGHSAAHVVEPSAVIAGIVSTSDMNGSVTIDRNSTPQAQLIYSLMTSNHPRLAAKANASDLVNFLATLPVGKFPHFVQPANIANAILNLNSDPTAAAVQFPSDGSTNPAYVLSPASVAGTVTYSGLFTTDTATTAFATGPQVKINDPHSGSAPVSLANNTYSAPDVVPGGPWKVMLDTTSMSNQPNYLYSVTASAPQSLTASNNGSHTANFTVTVAWPTPTLTSFSSAATSGIAKASPHQIMITGGNVHPHASQAAFTQTLNGTNITRYMPCTFVSNTQCTFLTSTQALGGANEGKLHIKDSAQDLAAATTQNISAGATANINYGVTGTGSHPTVVAGDNTVSFHLDRDGVIQRSGSWDNFAAPGPTAISTTLTNVTDMAYDPQFDMLYVVDGSNLKALPNASSANTAVSPNLIAALGATGQGIALAGASNPTTKGVAYVSIPASNQIKMVALDSNSVSVFADDDPASVSSALFDQPLDMVHVTIGAVPHLYVVQANHTLLDINVNTSSVQVIAGQAHATGSNDGLDANARFNNPTSLTADPYHNLYLTDTGNNAIRKIVFTDSGAAVTTLATVANAGSIVYAQPNLMSPYQGNLGALAVGTTDGNLKRLD